MQKKKFEQKFLKKIVMQIEIHNIIIVHFSSYKKCHPQSAHFLTKKFLRGKLFCWLFLKVFG